MNPEERKELERKKAAHKASKLTVYKLTDETEYVAEKYAIAEEEGAEIKSQFVVERKRGRKSK